MMSWTKNGLATCRHILRMQRLLWVPSSSSSVKASRRWWSTMANDTAAGISSVTLRGWGERSTTTWHSDSLFNLTTTTSMSQEPRKRRMGTTRTFSNTIGNENHGKTTKTLYLHVGPSGDCWTGDSIFAAKHLQPDYVKSIPLFAVNNDDMADDDGGDDDMQQKIDNLLQVLEDDQDLTASIYDTESIPSDLLDRIF
mmetsp:Transcript_42644/g.103144  ORF Transcript_42644/g.103144 Transcript_42644/m.103144 type:complete len:197 (+) Transcript_42644:249-839(+)